MRYYIIPHSIYLLYGKSNAFVLRLKGIGKLNAFRGGLVVFCRVHFKTRDNYRRDFFCDFALRHSGLYLFCDDILHTPVIRTDRSIRVQSLKIAANNILRKRQNVYLIFLLIRASHHHFKTNSSTI